MAIIENLQSSENQFDENQFDENQFDENQFDENQFGKIDSGVVSESEIDDRENDEEIARLNEQQVNEGAVAEKEEADKREILEKEKSAESSMKKKIIDQGMTRIRLPYKKGDINIEKVWINGVEFSIKRGEDVEIPTAVADLLYGKLDAEEGRGAAYKLDGSEEELN